MRALGTANNNQNNASNTITLPKSNADNMPDVAGAQDTIYLCNFRVSVDGEWLCLKELQDLDIQESGNGSKNDDTGTVANIGIESARRNDIDENKYDNTKHEREWVNYYCRCLFY